MDENTQIDPGNSRENIENEKRHSPKSTEKPHDSTAHSTERPEDSSQGKHRHITWKESSMQNVLAEYSDDLAGQSNQKQNTAKAKPSRNKPQNKNEVQKKSPKSHKDSPVNDDVDEDRQRAKRERHLKVYKDVQVLRDIYYDMYMTKLREKVENQREQIKKKDEIQHKKLQHQKEKELEERQKLKKRFDRHNLENNDDFVRNVPKSDSYKIIALQNKLKAEGLLKTQEDLDLFWSDVRDPQTLRKYLLIYKPLPSEPSVISMTKQASNSPGHTGSVRSGSISHDRSRTSSIGSLPGLAGQPDFRPMTQIEETKEPSRPVTREQSAPSPARKPKDEPVKRKEKDPSLVAKLAATELDRKFPQLELPPMACFTMEFGQKPPDPEKVLEELQMDRRQKERKLFIKRIRRMYNISQSNRATTDRILDQDEDGLLNRLQSPDIGEVIAIDEITHNLNRTLRGRWSPPQEAAEERPWTRHLEARHRRSIMPITEESEEGSGMRSRGSSASIVKSGSSKASGIPTQRDTRPVETPMLPLSYLHLEDQQSKVLEPKCLSTHWNNYLNVGKSKFAPAELV